MNPKPTNPQLTEADLDRALTGASDSILPSSGFADSVMTAVYRQASAPAPLPFPWKRALPGLVAAVAVLALLIATIVSVLESPASLRAPAISLNWQINVQTLAAHLSHQTSGATWLVISLAISGACLLFCRRLASPR
jgi:hypothetical protein